MTAQMRLGVFGGAFNPIHLGHLILAETARESLSLDRIVFIPTYKPPHKSSKELLPGAQRLEMIRLAIREQPAFVASEIELEQQKTSYSIDTIKALHAQLPQAKLFLLIGEDMLAVRWFAWEEIKRLCTVVAAHRPGSKAVRKGTGVKWLEMPQVEIASSNIRARLRAGRSIRYLIPPAVERYLEQHQLYRPAARA